VSVSDGQKVNAAVTNASFVSRTTDSNTVGKVDLENTDSGVSGGTITNAQRELNSISSFTGHTPNTVATAKPVWTNNDVGASTDDVKLRADLLTAESAKKVEGPASATDNAIPRYNLATGKLIQDSGVIIDDSDNITGVNDLTVIGTLTATDTNVLGSTITAEDPEIEINSGGNQATANSAASGIKVTMTDATDAKLGYDSSLASKFKVGEVGSESEVLSAATAQTLTGVKTLNTETINKHISTPANPAAGHLKLYSKSDDKFYSLDSGGTETELGGGAGVVDGDQAILAVQVFS